MFGFGIKSKAKRVIREEFFYDVSYMYEPLFKNLCEQGKMLGQNEYSVAIFYMMLMMNTLIENQKEFLGEDKDLGDVDHFINTHTRTINRIIHQANSPESEIREMLSQINKEFESVKSSLKVTSKKEASKTQEDNGNITKESIKEAKETESNREIIKKVAIEEIGFMSMNVGEDVNKKLGFLNGLHYECGCGSSHAFNDKTTHIIFALGIDKLRTFNPPPHATFQKNDLQGKELYVIKCSEDQSSINLVEILKDEIITIGISRTGNS